MTEPPRPSGRLWRAFARVVAVKPVTLFFMHLATWVDGPLLRASGGRLRLSFVIPVVLLRCTGARTGRTRDVPLLYVPVSAASGASFGFGAGTKIVVGSGGGRNREPAWCTNLRAHPRVACLAHGAWVPHDAHELSGDARTRAWAEAVELYPSYTRYQARVDRQIALFALIPVESGCGIDAGGYATR